MPKKQTGQDQIVVLTKRVEELANELVALKQQPIRVRTKRERGSARPEVYYVLNGVPTSGLPPQAIACARILAGARNVNHIPELEAMELMARAHAEGRIKTIQGSWYVFTYYRAKLIAGDYLFMRTE